ncbi:hypothetical protein, partial [Escherichia coli]|uniref:hypothetical protein n=1 Tax=Escherichia coli TaxID=562 RepID=UPI001BE90537
MKHTVADEYIFLNNHKTGINRRHKCSGVNRIVMMFSFVTEDNGTYLPQSLSSGITFLGQQLFLIPDE